ncbi:hypothetical protein ECANGB1_1233 [Enterospora canceri]|uniref:Uncharacterized protein n=1 Tax=Enterospora canceri TaxID=1081671 RepID=A0A1Y1S6J9_9MICR|nr:hypothetical protein ECANGB1_1233 [Enterospora canceri]
MGKMKDAYEALRRCKLEDETAVNLYAMEAMNALASNEYSSIFALREDVKIAEPITCEFNSIECKMEGDFNRNYANIANETEYLGKLTFLDKEYDVANSYIKKQLGCIVNDEHNLSLTKKQAETFTYNKVTGFTLSEPVLFQHNFIKIQETEYNLLEDDRSLSKKKCFTTRLVLKWLVRNMEKKGAKLTKEKRNGMVKWALTHIDEREKWIIDCLNLILVDEGSSEYKELAKSVCCKLK